MAIQDRLIDEVTPWQQTPPNLSGLKQINKNKPVLAHTIYLLGVTKEAAAYCSHSGPQFLIEITNLNIPNACERGEREKFLIGRVGR